MVDVGRITDEHGRSEYFVNSLGIGFDTVVTIRSHKLPIVKGFVMYLTAVIQTIILNHNPARMQIETDTQKWEDNVIMLTLCNGSREGGGFMLSPNSSNNDGKMEFVTVTKVSRAMMFCLLPEFLKGTHKRFKQVRMGEYTKLSLTSDRPLYIHADGEIYKLWRLGKFTNSSGTALAVPDCDENIHTWEARVIFVSDPSFARKFYYPPSLTLEKSYDLLFIGTGDREDACSPLSTDRFYAVKDKHAAATYFENDLVNVTNPLAVQPNLNSSAADVDNNGRVDQGWFVQLASGEKVLAENTVLYKTVYLTTFTPNNDPCVPGGLGKLYALDYKTSAAAIDFEKDGTKERSITIGGGIPSKTVMVISDKLTKVLVSVGSTNPDLSSESFAAGVVNLDPLVPNRNFFYQWWRELLNL